MKNFLYDALGSNIKADPYFWQIDTVRNEDNKLLVSGWALPFRGVPENVQLTMNGQAPESIEFTRSEELALAHPYWPNALYGNFAAVFDAASVDYPNKELEFVAAPVSGASEGNVYSRSFYYDPRVPAVIPPADLQTTIGTDGDFHYRHTGRTLFRNFEKALHSTTRKSLKDAKTILDWGSGPGRVAAHVLDQRGPDGFVGLDIVDGSTKWAAANLGADFRTCKTEPPLDIGSGTIELAYAYSVFTHIPEPLIDPWLAELNRVMARGGILMATVMGEIAMGWNMHHWGKANIAHVTNTGIFDGMSNDGLEHAGFSGDYYRNVFMTKSAMKKVFSKHFKIVDVIENFHWYQDLVVLRKT